MKKLDLRKKEHLSRPRAGFTLIELMMVVAIISLLAAIAYPKFANMTIKAREAAVLGKLGSFRSALAIYYADNEGFFPSFMNNGSPLATNQKYLNEIPSIAIPTVARHGNARAILNNVLSDVAYDSSFGVNSSPWAYFSATGRIAVNCTHTDTKSSVWSRW